MLYGRKITLGTAMVLAAVCNGLAAVEGKPDRVVLKIDGTADAYYEATPFNSGEYVEQNEYRSYSEVAYQCIRSGGHALEPASDPTNWQPVEQPT
jgi:hypothetical protein